MFPPADAAALPRRQCPMHAFVTHVSLLPALHVRGHSHSRTTPRCRATWRDVVNADSLHDLSRGSLAVPRHLWNSRMRQKGVYRSVEYVVEKLSLDDVEIPSTAWHYVPSERRDDVVATLRPMNSLLPRFERSWPVSVRLGDAKLWSYKRDIICSTIATLLLACTFLTFGVLGPAIGGIYSIPSASMEPSLHIGDAILVEKLTLRKTPPKTGEIVLFRPPARLQRILARAEGGRVRRLRRNDLFVKRVVGQGGDVICVRNGGVFVNSVKVDDAAPGSPYVAPGEIPRGYVFVVGDNAEKSIDSRYWGLLPIECVVGRPVARIFPVDRIDLHF